MTHVKDKTIEQVSGSPHGTPERGRPLAGGFVGLAAGGVALGAAQLVAGMVGGASSPMIAVGGAAIDATPEWLKNFAIRRFGSADKLALLVGIGAILAIAAAVIGVFAVRRPWLGLFGIGAFGVIGIAASVTRPTNGLRAAIPSILGAAAGIFAYVGLRRAAGLRPVTWFRPSGWTPLGRSQSPTPDRRSGGPPPGFDRRRFLWAGAAAAGVAAVSGVAGQYLVRRASASASRAAVRLPKPADAAPPAPPGADLRIPGLSSFVTPNGEFYRVDTALFVPAVDAANWKLRIHGMVDREITIDYAQLLARPLIERDVTLTCVSNQVGGHYIGNARWLGARLKDLIVEAGVHPGASQIVSRSSDGFTVGTPTEAVMDGRDAMLAVGMNGEPLPLSHGFPVRMVVPGLYGYVSATKWVVDIELTTFAAYDAYWINRGWSQQAPIKTESRIDTPDSGSQLRAGRVPLAGVAWAQHRGIAKVEVRADEGPWIPAELAAEDTIDTWRQWVYRWEAVPGDHVLSVRATDDTGATQTPNVSAPGPNGATGDHTIEVSVS